MAIQFEALSDTELMAFVRGERASDRVRLPEPFRALVKANAKAAREEIARRSAVEEGL